MELLKFYIASFMLYALYFDYRSQPTLLLRYIHTGCPKCKRTNDFPITPEILVRVNFQKYLLEDHYLTFFVSKFQRSSSKGLEMAGS